VNTLKVYPIFRGPDCIEFDGTRWLDSSTALHEEPFITDTQVANLGLCRIHRKEKWTSVCYEVSWDMSFRNTVRQPIQESAENEAKKKRVVFFKQKLIFQLGWRLMKRDLSGASGTADIHQLKQWLDINYPNVDIPLDDLTKKFPPWSLVSGLFLQLLVTITVGAITRFHVGVPGHAAWILVWLYGSASLRWTTLITNSVTVTPCLLLKKWLLFAAGVLLEIMLAIGVYGGITFILVELLGSMCNATFSLAAGFWILIGFVIACVFTIAVCVVFYSSTIIGNI
jgi:hypothetical protein